MGAYGVHFSSSSSSSGGIESQGFALNPYDLCVANKVINGKQFTVVWHVDDIKMSHADEKEVSKLITWLKSVYGADMRVSRGKVHGYLGMTLDFTNKGEAKVTMIDYLKGVINDFPEIITGTAITTATANLFDVRPKDERKVLGEEQARAFHRSVAQLLFATTREKKDIMHTVAFLTTRVKSPDEDDWMKLKRLLKYIRGTIYMPLILKADSLNIVKWWVRDSRQLQRAHWSHRVNGERIHYGDIEETKDQHEKFYIIRAGRRPRCGATDALDEILHQSTGLQVERIHISPRQYERNAAGNKRKRVKQQANQTYQREILFYQRSSWCRRNYDQTLPNK
jgi:hypothetical protein